MKKWNSGYRMLQIHQNIYRYRYHLGLPHISVDIWVHHRPDLPSHWFSSSKSCRREGSVCVSVCARRTSGCLWRHKTWCRLSATDRRRLHVCTRACTHTLICAHVQASKYWIFSWLQLVLNRWKRHEKFSRFTDWSSVMDGCIRVCVNKWVWACVCALWWMGMREGDKVS